MIKDFLVPYIGVLSSTTDSIGRIVFTARRSYASAVNLGSRNSVRPYVRTSVTRVLCD